MRIESNYEIDFSSLQELKGSAYKINADDTGVLFIVDMIKGFATEGPLSSSRVNGISSSIAELAQAFVNRKLPIVALSDSHDPESVEFRSYPPHCIKGTSECDLVNELQSLEKHITVIPKGSVNGFLEDETRILIDKMIGSGITNFIISGCCTDICVKFLSITLANYLHTRNIDAQVVVAYKYVETYDAPGHNANAMNLFALYEMRSNGVTIVEEVDIS